MSLFKCSQCPNTYKYDRNLKRHIRESHEDIDFWFCAIGNCVKKYVRRSYLSKHLINKHGYDKLKAHETACKAPRGIIDREAYYDKESEDDTVFDLIGEMNAAEYGERYMTTISEFNVQDQSSCASVSVEINGETSSVDSNNSGNGAVLVGSVEYSDITDSDMSDVNDAEVKANEVESSVDSVRDDAVNGVINDDDNESVETVLDYNDGVSSDGYTEMDENNNEKDDQTNETTTDDVEVIVIDSDDEKAIDVSQMRTKTQTFYNLYRKQTRYIGDKVIDVIITTVKEYDEHIE